MNNTIYLIIDIQNDFCKGGALEVKDTCSLFNPLNSHIQKVEKEGALIAFTQDWHPINHSSFLNNGGKWPKHCIANSKGAELHPSLYIPNCHFIIHKGTTNNTEGYSAFENNILAKILKKYNITNVIICGIATSFCVAQTAISSCKLGFNTYIIKRLTRDTYCSNTNKTLNDLSKNNCIKII